MINSEKFVLTSRVVKIGLISDTHGHLDDQLIPLLQECDEVWHAGDIGDIAILDRLKKLKKTVRAVFGNIDGAKIRSEIPAEMTWQTGSKKIFMTHIGGYPGHYAAGIKQKLLDSKPDIFICGHSHILKVIFDKDLNLLHLNPGACGKEGFHKVKSMLRFSIEGDQIKDMAVVELQSKIQ